MDSLVVDVVLGLVFVFGLFALAVSAVTEAVSRWIGLRGEYLLRGLRTLLDGGGKFELKDLGLLRFGRWTSKIVGALWPGERRPTRVVAERPHPLVTRVMNHPLVKATADKGDMPEKAGNAALDRKQRRALPSYQPARNVASALVDVLVPDAAGRTTIDELRTGVNRPDVPDEVKRPLLAMLDEAADDVGRFRQLLELWYDDHMARVSGWYKRHTRWISLAFAVLLALAFNVNTISIAQALYGDQALRESVVTQAVEASDCGDKAPADCLAAVREQVDAARNNGLPVGWGIVPACVPAGADCSWWEQHGLADEGEGTWNEARFLLILCMGFLLTALSAVPGARFWFDLLSRLGSLRETGPRPTPTPVPQATPAAPVPVVLDLAAVERAAAEGARRVLAGVSPLTGK